MLSLFRSYSQRDIFYLIPIVSFALLIRLRYFFHLKNSGKGFPQSDDSQWYLDYAYSLMTSFRIGLHMDEILYLGYNLLLTALLAVFKDSMYVLFIQAFTSAISVILVYHIARMLFNRMTAFIASIFYSLSWGMTLWTTYILADSFFFSLLLLCVYFLVKSQESDRKRYKLLFVVTSVYLIIFKPTGIMILSLIGLYLIMMHRIAVWRNLLKYRLYVGIAGSLLLAVVVLAFGSGALDPLIQSMQFNAKKVLYNIYANGWIYDKSSPHDYFFRSDYRVNVLNSLILSFILNNWDHIMVLYGRRTVAFLGMWVWRIDLTSLHGLKKFVEHSMPTVLFLTGTIAAIVNKRFLRASVLWLVILAVFAFCLIFFIDAMYRYKAPALPFLAIVCAYGAERIMTGVYAVGKNYTELLLWRKRKY